MENIKVIVVGTLGEAYKKLFELEYLLDRGSANGVLLTTLAQYKELTERWPVTEDLSMVVVNMRHTVFQLAETVPRAQELDLDAVRKMFQLQQRTQEQMRKINSAACHVGPGPVELII